MYRAKIRICHVGFSLLAALYLLSCASTTTLPIMLPGLVNIRMASGVGLQDFDVPGDSHQWLLDRLSLWAIQSHVTVIFTDMDIERKFGNVHCDLHCTIRINSSRSVNSQASTMLHELAHLLIPETDRVINELQAESVAYLVGQQVGLDNGQQALAYLGQFPSTTRNSVIPLRSPQINAAVKILVKAAK